MLNDWFGHSGTVAETYYLKTTEADFDLAVKQLGGPLGTTTRASEFPKRSQETKNPGESGVMMFPDGSGGSIEYSWVDAFGTSLRSNSHVIADRLKRLDDRYLSACITHGI